MNQSWTCLGAWVQTYNGLLNGLERFFGVFLYGVASGVGYLVRWLGSVVGWPFRIIGKREAKDIMPTTTGLAPDYPEPPQQGNGALGL